jgi:hypothetical protein
MTMTIGSGVAFGTYPITVTGTSGSISQTSTVILTITGAATPIFSLPSGNYTGPQTLTITDTTPGATIYYTTDDSTPSTSSNVYNGPITVSSTENIEAIAVASGYPNSAIAGAYYAIGSASMLGEWSWMGGSSSVLESGNYGTLGLPVYTNSPGALSGATSWTDQSGNLWLFGASYNLSMIGEFNDLWEFNSAANEWTWMGGSSKGVLSFYSSYGQPGVYGTLGIPAAGNIPGSRYDAANWTDSSGNFWLFGGNGGSNGSYNDLWKFNPSTK